ncbi:hypothetical protein FB45DRAFT_998309 [Roridomyces roridus]|uniref:Zn(2)-C6 fungal-type domain-containing protein n=1 Tax=Roridomyces roridus TaxID=1738132 RepID=A0AAD7FYY7_9AGAR|nr:hypothetical protein FB45DRAFT_998309 [Roridomyces roridus]
MAKRALDRGTACLFCRKRKVKCDGGRPACRRCHEMGRAEDCEYNDPQARSENEHLESSIARLEARIRQLGGTLPTSPEVILHEPHLEGQPLGSFSFSSWSIQRPHQAPPTRLQVTLSDGWWRTPIPPPNVTKILIEFFARHASQFGFFLNGPRIVKSVFSPDARRPIFPRLLNGILLFGINLSGSPALQAHENVFLARVQQSSTLSNAVQPYHIVQNIQAEALLAQYFLRQGRFLEAMHHINAAASLSIGCGLRRLNGHHSERNAYPLPSTRDAVEQGERVNAFWSIMAAHKVFSVMMQWPSSVSDILDEQVDLPWPLDMEVYDSGIVPVNPHGQSTMKSFVEDPMSANFEAANSTLAQHAKAAALFERASHMGGQRASNLSDPDEQAQFTSFEHGLNQFMQTLPPFNGQGTIDTIRLRLVTFTLCQVAIIQLHSAFDNPASIHKCLNAARAVAWEHVDSTMGTLWVAVCQVIIRGIATIKNPRSSSRGWAASVSNADYPALNMALKSLIGTMSTFAPRCLLIDYQLNKVQETYKTLAGR